VLCGPERHQWVNPRLTATLLRCVKDERFTVSIEFIFGAHGVDTARNLALDKAREQQADWCVMLDNDITCNDPLGILAEANAANLDIVSVGYGISMADGDFRPSVNFAAEYAGSFRRITAAGAGVLLIRSAVWQKFPPKAALFEWSAAAGEDVHFCRLAQSAGFKLWTHASLAGHLKTVDLSPFLQGVRA
jgi:glycosyltransferase involved in cell wall biosynthesis